MPRKQLAVIDDGVCCPSVTAAPLSEHDARRPRPGLRRARRPRPTAPPEPGRRGGRDLLLRPSRAARQISADHLAPHQGPRRCRPDRRNQAGPMGLVEHRARAPRRDSARTRARVAWLAPHRPLWRGVRAEHAEGAGGRDGIEAVGDGTLPDFERGLAALGRILEDVVEHEQTTGHDVAAPSLRSRRARRRTRGRRR